MNASMKNNKVLYFICGGRPTAEQKEEIKALGALVRNASAYGSNDFCEKCDFVAGPNVPEAYLKLYKRADAVPEVPEQRNHPAADVMPDEVSGQQNRQTEDPAEDKAHSFEHMSVRELREFAKAHNVILPATVTTRDEIIARLGGV